jgi:metal-dependent amidase/aminoacylase/carboxypeptidase family protein
MDAKTGAQERFDSARDGLIALSRRIHAHPELGFEEERACAWLCEALADAGFDVQSGICELPTAFRARAGSGPLHVAICAEYDCLPGIGHACGHNVIAASALGAALAASASSARRLKRWATPAARSCCSSAAPSTASTPR